MEEIRSGLGGASVFRVEDASGQKQFLKIAQGEEEAKALHQEIERTSWLRSQGINVPEILDAIKDGKITAMTRPFAPRALPRFITTTGQSAPLRRIGTFGLAVGAACAFSLGIAGQVLTFRTRA